MSTSQKIRILLSAYQCGIGMGSVSQIGWEWYSRLSEDCHVTLLTHIRNRPALEAAGAPLFDSNIIFIDTEWFAMPLYRFATRCFPHSGQSRFLIASLDFFVYDWVALRQVQRKLKECVGWDIVHVVTPVSPFVATHLYKLNIPLVLGPWNGGMRSPTAFPEIMRAESGWFYPIRNLGRIFDVIIGSTRHASIIFTATQATIAAISKRYQQKCRFLLENGVDLDLFSVAPYPPFPTDTNPLHIVFVGRLIPVKGVTMLLKAIKELDFPVQLTVVGDGPERTKLEAVTADLQLAEQVNFRGNLSLNEVSQLIRLGHVFCLPSVKESGGAVLLEAMAVGRPVIAIDFGGPAEIVDDGVGIKLPATGEADVINGLVATFVDLREHPEQWRARGQEGRQRVENNYSWAAKIKIAIGFYRQILDEKR